MQLKSDAIAAAAAAAACYWMCNAAQMNCGVMSSVPLVRSCISTHPANWSLTEADKIIRVI